MPPVIDVIKRFPAVDGADSEIDIQSLQTALTVADEGRVREDRGIASKSAGCYPSTCAATEDARGVESEKYPDLLCAVVGDLSPSFP
jgi:hypothetical protein